MSVVARCGSVALLLSLFVGVVPALGQATSKESSGTSWTDPPVRGAAGPEGSAVAKPPEAKAAEPKVPASTAEAPAAAEPAKPPQSAAVPPTPTPAERAASELGVKPVAGGQDAAGSRSFLATARTPERPRFDVGSQALRTKDQRHRLSERAVRPRSVVERRQSTVDRPDRRLALASSRRRAYRSYAWTPEPGSHGRIDPYDGRSDRPSWTGRRLAGWGGLLSDNRASRIAQARSAGYAVIRLRTYAYPDGTRVQQFVPFDSEPFDGND